MKKQTGQKSIRILIIVLVILLAVSGTALAGTVLYRHFYQPQGSLAVVPDNVISPEKEISASTMPVRAVTLSHRTVNTVKAAPMTVTAMAATPMTVRTVSAKSIVVDKAEGEEVTLKLYRNHAEDSTPFQVNNMFPGDVEQKSYFLEVSYKGNLIVHFRADVRSGCEKLAEVLKCRVSLGDGTLLYDGLMKDMPNSIPYSLPYSSGTTETVVYEITAYLDTSVGNEYMAKELYADFRWWVNEDGGGSDDPDTPDAPTDPSDPTDPTEPGTEPDEPDNPTNPTEPDEPDNPTNPTEPDEPGVLIPPQTGDNSHFCIWFWIAMISLLINIILLLPKVLRKDREQEDEDEQ